MSHRELFFEDGELVLLPKSPVAQEIDLEHLIVHNPDLLALPGENHKLFVVRNQFPISDEEIKNRYALDILMVRDDAVPVLVEVKRCTDTRIKREVVAQMLDYACYLSRYNQDDLQEVFRADSNLKSDVCQLLANDDAFLKKVSENLASGNLVLVFAADEIPQSLFDLIDYLQQILPKTTVYGVEVCEYKSGDGKASVIERKVHYTQKPYGNEKSRTSSAHTWNEYSYLQHTNQYYPELAETVERIIKHFTDKYYTKFGSGNIYATFNVFDRPSGAQLLSMDVGEPSATIWFYPESKPFHDILRTESSLKDIPGEYRPKETPQFMKMDIHALMDETISDWLFREIDKLFKPE